MSTHTALQAVSNLPADVSPEVAAAFALGHVAGQGSAAPAPAAEGGELSRQVFFMNRKKGLLLSISSYAF